MQNINDFQIVNKKEYGWHSEQTTLVKHIPNHWK